MFIVRSISGINIKQVKKRGTRAAACLPKMKSLLKIEIVCSQYFQNQNKVKWIFAVLQCYLSIKPSNADKIVRIISSNK